METKKNILFEKLIKHADKLHVRECIIWELYEQKTFFSINTIERMLNYTLEDFNYLYEIDAI